MLRGDGQELDSNLWQLLHMKADDDPNLAEWLKRKEFLFTPVLIMASISIPAEKIMLLPMS